MCGKRGICQSETGLSGRALDKSFITTPLGLAVLRV